MSTLTIFLAKLLGLYCLFIAVALTANRKNSLEATDGFLRSPALMLLAGLFALAVGLPMVIGHNVWSGGALPIVVTLLGWASLIKGGVLLAFPPGSSLALYRSLNYQKHFTLYMAATFVLGLYLTLAGFSA